MSRQAANVPAGYTGRDLVWQAIREMRTFVLQDLVKRTGLRSGTVEDYLRALLKAGLLARSGSQPSPLGIAGAFPRAEYSLVRDLGLDTPRVRKNGTLIPPSGRQRMWRAMGILKDFSLRDLVATASLPEAGISRREAEYYCDWLTKGHYLRTSGNGRYCIVPVMRHGPRAPQVQRVRRLFDPNTGEIVCESKPIEEKAR